MDDSTQPGVMANVITILLGCVAAFVSIGRKIDRSRKQFSWLWLSTEIGSCILAGFIGYESYLVFNLYPCFLGCLNQCL